MVEFAHALEDEDFAFKASVCEGTLEGGQNFGFALATQVHELVFCEGEEFTSLLEVGEFQGVGMAEDAVGVAVESTNADNNKVSPFGTPKLHSALVFEHVGGEPEE